MQSIINDALKNAELEKEINKPGSTNAMEDDFVGQPRIVIIGCGGAGNNTVNRIHHMGVSGAETIAINTDKQHLDMIQADKRILIGKSLTKGLGAGGYPDVGKRAAEMARPTLEAILDSADLVFITAGMEEVPVPVQHPLSHPSPRSRVQSLSGWSATRSRLRKHG